MQDKYIHTCAACTPGSLPHIKQLLSFPLEAKPSLSQLMEHVYPDITTHWLEVGIHLGIDDRELDAIEVNRHKVQDRCMDMLRLWLKQNRHGSKPTTWKVLLTSLKKARLTKLSENLEEQLLNGKLDD